MLTLPDLNRIKVFYVVYKTGNLVKAGEALQITRSAVSQSLKALEAELATRLFLRDSKKVLATEPGELLYRSLEPFFTELEATLRALDTGKREAAGLLRIGAPQDFGSSHLTAAIVAFHKKHPRITFELMLATPVRLLEQLSAGRLDLAFVDNADVHAKSYPVSVVTVMNEKFVPVCSRGYFERRVKRLSPGPDELKDLEFVDYLGHAPVTKLWLKHQFGKIAPTVRVSFAAESVRALVRAAEGGLGVAVLPEQLVEGALKTGRLKRLHPDGRALVNQIALARRLERPVSAREKEFVEFYREFARG
jgi:DNA-binding transcriptional LysR family regulator